MAKNEQATIAELDALGARMESEICDFDVEIRAGRLYAGRTPFGICEVF